MFKEIPANNQSIAQRKLVYGVGINDADYMTLIIINDKTKICPIYSKWKSMLSRCYLEDFKIKNPTYTGCTVCDEWLLFSNFKRWMENQEWQGMEIDKDCIKPGNKIYCKEFCAFIDKATNALLNDHFAKRGIFLRGVTFNEENELFRSRVNINGNPKHLGYFKCEKQASDAYIKAKVEIILKSASEQKEPRVANGLRLHADILAKGLRPSPFNIQRIVPRCYGDRITITYDSKPTKTPSRSCW